MLQCKDLAHACCCIAARLAHRVDHHDGAAALEINDSKGFFFIENCERNFFRLVKLKLAAQALSKRAFAESLSVLRFYKEFLLKGI